MDEVTKATYMLRALELTGPRTGSFNAWQKDLLGNATAIMEAVDSSGPLAKLVGGMGNSKIIFGTVKSIKKEASSTRGLVTFETKVGKWSPEGTETARTDRMGEKDKPESGLEMGQLIKTLIGHRVKVWIEVEMPRNATPEDKGVRVIRHLTDLGLAETAGTEG